MKVAASPSLVADQGQREAEHLAVQHVLQQSQEPVHAVDDEEQVLERAELARVDVEEALRDDDEFAARQSALGLETAVQVRMEAAAHLNGALDTRTRWGSRRAGFRMMEPVRLASMDPPVRSPSRSADEDPTVSRRNR